MVARVKRIEIAETEMHPWSAIRHAFQMTELSFVTVHALPCGVAGPNTQPFPAFNNVRDTVPTVPFRTSA